MATRLQIGRDQVFICLISCTSACVGFDIPCSMTLTLFVSVGWSVSIVGSILMPPNY